MKKIKQTKINKTEQESRSLEAERHIAKKKRKKRTGQLVALVSIILMLTSIIASVVVSVIGYV